MKIVSKLVIAIIAGAAAAFLSNFSAPPAKLVVFVGVTVVAFFVIPTPKSK